MSDVSEMKLVGRQNNMETYTAKMEIVIKKFFAKDVNEALLLKIKLKENKKTRKIYDVRVDKNILFIFIHPKENIDDLLYGKISKEVVIKGHCEPIKINELNDLFQYKQSMCKIRFHKIINNQIHYVFGSGFFLTVNIKGISFNKCLMTNNHVLNEDFFKKSREIEIEYNNAIKVLTIKNRQIYTNKTLDYTCIEIFDNDNIQRFFKINNQILINDLNLFINKEIFILQFPQGEDLSFSDGKILSIQDGCFTHNCSTQKGSSGSPIILREDSSIIGLHHSSSTQLENDQIVSYNLSTSILTIIKDLLKAISRNKNIIGTNVIMNNDNNIIIKQKKEVNYIIAEFAMDEKSIYRDIKIINSYEQYKRENPEVTFDKTRENEKDLMDYCKIEIYGQIIPFSYYYKFKDKKVRVKYIFNKNIKQMNLLFSGLNNLISVDLSNFNGQGINNMELMFLSCISLITVNFSNCNIENVVTLNRMFYNCNSLKSVNFSNCNAQNAITISQMFFGCNSLQSIDLSNCNMQNIINMDRIFEGCYSLQFINLLNCNFQNVTNMECMFARCKSLKSINLSKLLIKNLRIMKSMFFNCDSLQSIDLSNLNAQNVINVDRIFEGCYSLQFINLLNCNFQNVTSMAYMFAGCKSLKSVNLSKILIKNLNNIKGMFCNCESLQSIDLSNFNTQKVIDMEEMFKCCKSLKSIDLSNWKIQNVKNMKNIFNACSSLAFVNLSNIYATNLTNVESMFSYCTSLASIDLSKWNI